MKSTPFSIGNVTFPNQLALAPLSGITNLPFRRIARELGAGMVVSELVSSNGLVQANKRTQKYLLTHPDEWPIVMQIFGDEPEPMAKAAKLAEQAGAHVVDINIGCPVSKVVKRGAGCALMRDLPRASRLICAVADAVSVPVTVKMRAGWSSGQVNAPEFAAMAEDQGAQAVTVHGRTRQQMFSGTADRDVIRRTVENVSIPVIGNGDVTDAASAARMLEETGATAVMIGRAAQGNPWIFGNIATEWQTGIKTPSPSPEERLRVIRRHMAMYVDHSGESTAVREMRKHLCWYTKGLPGGARFREKIQDITRLIEMEEVLLRYFDSISTPAASHAA